MTDTSENTIEQSKVHSLALQRFDTIYSNQQEGRRLALSDRRFCWIVGGQWEDEFIAAAFENKPRIEINKVQMSINSINSEYRQNRIGVNFTSKDGTENSELADICQDLYRADFKASGGKSASDNCFEEGIVGGMGALYLTTELVDEFGASDSEQRIVIDPIFDADQTVFYDLDAKKYDKSDARFAYKLNSMSKEGYEEQYGDDPTNWPVDNYVGSFDWFAADVVTVAEYFLIENTTIELSVYKNVQGGREEYTEEDLTALKKRELKDKGTKFSKKVKKKQRQVRKYIMSGGKILNGDGEIILGTMIPIIPFYAKRNYINNIERFQGHVRNSKDAQVLKNIMMSKLAETSAVSANPVPVFFPEQMAGYSDDWADQNINNNAYLLLNPMKDSSGNPMPMGAIEHTRPPEIAPATGALLNVADIDLQEVMGKAEAAEVAQPNISGVAVELIQNKLDMRTYIYVSNFERTQQRLGEVWLDKAKVTYVEDNRKLKTIGKQGEIGSITLNEKTMDKTGTVVNKGDLTRADFDVEVNVSASTESKRAAAVRAFSGMASIAVDPAEKSILMGLAMQNMDVDGGEDYQEYNRKKLLAAGVGEPNEEDIKSAEEAAAANQQQEPTPEQDLLSSTAEENRARAAKLASEADINVAKVGNVEADTALKEAQRVNELDNVEGKNIDRIVSIDKELRDERVQDEERLTARAQQAASNQNSPLG